MLTSNAVTAEAAARYEGGGSAVRALAGELAEMHDDGLWVKAANGRPIPVFAGQWVVRYAPGDIGVMSDGEYQRWFGTI